jgi:hypothetical protein
MHHESFLPPPPENRRGSRTRPTVELVTFQITWDPEFCLAWRLMHRLVEPPSLSTEYGLLSRNSNPDSIPQLWLIPLIYLGLYLCESRYPFHLHVWNCHIGSTAYE